MHADYIANPLYDNNPFIEALPPMLSGKDLIRALAVIPPYSDSDRDRSTGERLQLLSSLYEFYQPLSMTVDLYCEIHTAMQHCYGQYSVQSEAATFQNGYSLMHGNALAASIGGGNSFSVVGVSGLGKSTALQRVLSLYPQVIEHTEYHGQKIYCHQIPYLVVQTPHDASIKALILDIYLQIDSLIGTTYQKDALSRRLSIDVLVSQLNQIVRVNHIGLLVIDELQNITYHKSDGGMPLVLFGGVGQQTKLLTKQNPFCLRRMSIHKILFCKWIWKMIHLPTQIYYQYQHKEHDCRCSVQIAVDKHYRLIHGCTSKTQFRPGRFTEI